MRSKWPIVLAAALAPASAVRANVVGGDLQNFNPALGGIDFVTVQSSETLDPGLFNVSLMLNHAVNSLPYFDDTTQQNRLSYNDTLTMMDTGLGFGILNNFEAGFAVQSLLAQHASGGSAHGEFQSWGPVNTRLYGKARLFGDAEHGLAVIGTAVFDRVKNNPYVGRGGSPIGIFEVAGDTTIEKFAVAGNVGYRFRKKGEQIPSSALAPVGNQYIASAAISYLLSMVDTKLIVEIFGARPAGEQASGISQRQGQSAEILGGLKHDWSTEIALNAGAGTQLLNGVSSPDWRIYAGVNWTFRPPLPRLAKEITARILRPTEQKTERGTLHSLNFAFGSDSVPSSALPELEQLAKEINESPYKKIIVEGHTDSVGRAEFNMKLSQRRADTVRKWMIEHANVDPKKIAAVGYGATRPIADNGNFQGREKNRRVDVQVVH